MPTNKPDLLAYLENRANAAIEELRRVAPEAVKELLETQAAIAAIKDRKIAEIVVDDYSGFRKPSLAVEAYLAKASVFTERRTIAKAIADGGFARGEDTRPFWNVLDSIKHNISVGKLLERDGLIGLPAWADDPSYLPPSIPFQDQGCEMEAILDWLQKRGSPATLEEVVDGVLAAGFQMDNERRETNIRVALEYELQDPNGRLIRIEGLIDTK